MFGGGHLISAITRRGVALLRDAVAGELLLIAATLAAAAIAALGVATAIALVVTRP